MHHDVEESRLEDESKNTFQKLIRLHKGGFTKPFKPPCTKNNDRLDTTKPPGPTSRIIYFLLYYCLWPHSRSNWAYATRGEYITPEIYTTRVFCEGEVGHIPEGGGTSFRSHHNCGSWGRAHQNSVSYLWPSYAVYYKLEANRRPRLLIYQSPQVRAKFSSQ